MIRAPFNQLIRQAESVIENHEQVKFAPRVIWAGVEEAPANFALRIAGLQIEGADRILAAVPFGYAVPAEVQAVPFAPKLFVLLHPTYCRYRVASGGRGSGKSHAFATAIILRMLARRIRVLCAREFMRSLRESVHHLLKSKIEALGVDDFFAINERAISCTVSDSEVIFNGLYQNSSALKSLEDISICWWKRQSPSQRNRFKT